MQSIKERATQYIRMSGDMKACDIISRMTMRINQLENQVKKLTQESPYGTKGRKDNSGKS